MSLSLAWQVLQPLSELVGVSVIRTVGVRNLPSYEEYPECANQAMHRRIIPCIRWVKRKGFSFGKPGKMLGWRWERRDDFCRWGAEDGLYGSLRKNLRCDTSQSLERRSYWTSVLGEGV